MGCEGFGEMVGSCWFAKVQAVWSGAIAATGLVMAVAGVVVLAWDCSLGEEWGSPWALLVWGLITLLLYGLASAASVDRAMSASGARTPNPILQGLQHLASMDGACAWWFAKELIEAWAHLDDWEPTNCAITLNTLGFALCLVRLIISILYGVFFICVMIFFCCKKK